MGEFFKQPGGSGDGGRRGRSLEGQRTVSNVVLGGGGLDLGAEGLGCLLSIWAVIDNRLEAGRGHLRQVAGGQLARNGKIRGYPSQLGHVRAKLTRLTREARFHRSKQAARTFECSHKLLGA